MSRLCQRNSFFINRCIFMANTCAKTVMTFPATNGEMKILFKCKTKLTNKKVVINNIRKY